MYNYEELLKQKEGGKKLDWDKITEEQLSFLFIDENIIDSVIACLYDIDKIQVTRKRYKWNIKLNSFFLMSKIIKELNKDLES